MRHAVGISRQINICGDKAEQVKYRGTRPLQFPSPIPSLSPYTHLSLSLSGGLWPGCRQVGWWSPLREKREIAQHLHFTHTPSGKPNGVALHYTCPPPPEAVHWASPWGRPQHVKGHVLPGKRKKEEDTWMLITELVIRHILIKKRNYRPNQQRIINNCKEYNIYWCVWCFLVS